MQGMPHIFDGISPNQYSYGDLRHRPRCVVIRGQIFQVPPASRDGTVNVGTLYQCNTLLFSKAIGTQVHGPRAHSFVAVRGSANAKFLLTVETAKSGPVSASSLRLRLLFPCFEVATALCDT